MSSNRVLNEPTSGDVGARAETPKPRRRLSLAESLAYSFGVMGNNILANGLSFLALPIYSIGLGINPAWIGIALMIPRFWDAITDPLMGYISDNTRTRWGRRKPYILIGSTIGGAFFALLWNPPSFLGSTGTMVYFCICSVLMLTAYTVYIVPHTALAPELTSDFKERNRLVSVRVFFMGLTGIMLPWVYRLCFFPYFGSSEVEGVRVVGILFGSWVVIAGMIPAIFCKENPDTQNQEKITIGPALKSMRDNQPFWMLTGLFTLSQLGMLLALPMSTFVGLYYIFEGVEGAKTENAKLFGMLGSSWAAITVLFSPFMTYVINWFGRKTTVILGLVLMAIGMASTWVFFTPENPYLSLIAYGITSPGNAAVMAVISAMLADVCDYDEWKSGLRREGIFSAVESFVVKTGIAMAAGLTGVLIAAAGIDTSSRLAQSPEAVVNLRLMFALIPAGFISIALICAFKYPLTEERMSQYRREIEARKLAKP